MKLGKIPIHLLRSRDMADKHLMVDLETLGLADDAVIVSIGAVMFDPRGKDTEDSLDDTFYVRISAESAQRAGCTIDAGTVMWWLNQSHDAQRELISEDQTSFNLAITAFGQWIYRSRPPPTRVWAKGYDFDISKLRDAFKRASELWPIHFASSRCVRTVTELADPEGELPEIGVGVAHNALDDSKRQVLSVQRAYRILNA